MKSLYRRYRPLKLSDVVGQEQVTTPLIKSLEQNKISHAYLFVGPRGCGKTSVARILAHEVNGFKYTIEDNYVDIIEIDGASNRGIDNIRELREKVAIAPTSGKYKVYIIDEVHMLTKEAFNALLKTLEEPPAHAIFIMATTDAYKVPITITSRAQTYTFKLADSATMLKFLKDVVKKEKIKIDDDALNIIVKKGEGSFRDSLSLLDQISTLSDDITKEQILTAFGLPQDEKIKQLLDCYSDGDIDSTNLLIKDLLYSGVKPETITDELISYIVANPSPELLPLLDKLADVKEPYAIARLLVALCQTQHDKPSNEKSHQEKETRSKQTPKPQTFNWQEYVSKVAELSDAVYSQLIKCDYAYSDSVLHIYPRKKITKTIISKDNNKRILLNSMDGNVKITIHEENETPNMQNKDERLAKLSDIMGGEVVNDGGKSPF